MDSHQRNLLITVGLVDDPLIRPPINLDYIGRRWQMLGVLVLFIREM